MPTFVAYVGAAVAEIAGRFAFWAWLRLDKPAWWLLPGILSLAVFAYLLTLVDSASAGRAYAAYGGVYITASLPGCGPSNQQMPDRWDFIGATVCIAGAGIILLGPRGA